MVRRKLTPSEKIFLFLIANSLLIGGIFAARLLGFTTDSLLVLTTAVSLEIIYLAFSIQRAINKNTQTLVDLEKYISDIKESEEKAHAALIYTGHQMKFIQHELDILKRHSILKSIKPGNGHHPKAQA